MAQTIGWVLLALAFACGVAVALWLGRKIDRWGRARRSRRGRAGELAARRLLRRAGFEVEAEQAAGRLEVKVDGASHHFDLYVDYLVRRRGRRYVAEVKTGTAASVDHAATRRQLLEYSVAFSADGLLLVDMEHQSIHRVEFPAQRRLSRAAS